MLRSQGPPGACPSRALRTRPSAQAAGQPSLPALPGLEHGLAPPPGPAPRPRASLLGRGRLGRRSRVGRDQLGRRVDQPTTGPTGPCLDLARAPLASSRGAAVLAADLGRACPALVPGGLARGRGTGRRGIRGGGLVLNCRGQKAGQDAAGPACRRARRTTAPRPWSVRIGKVEPGMAVLARTGLGKARLRPGTVRSGVGFRAGRCRDAATPDLDREARPCAAEHRCAFFCGEVLG